MNENVDDSKRERRPISGKSAEFLIASIGLGACIDTLIQVTTRQIVNVPAIFPWWGWLSVGVVLLLDASLRGSPRTRVKTAIAGVVCSCVGGLCYFEFPNIGLLIQGLALALFGVDALQLRLAIPPVIARFGVVLGVVLAFSVLLPGLWKLAGLTLAVIIFLGVATGKFRRSSE
jgi:hypothetical protein